jgi:alpha-tubulin suppressor-like RCC1 family protein
VPLPEAVDTLLAGWSITCALGVSGQAYCWGDNSAGALGDGTTTDHASPALVATGQRFRQLATVGPFSVCGLTAAGSAWCWGGNASGQLGNGSRAAQLSPGVVSGSHAFKALTGSEWHACGLDVNGRAYCWGGNFVGQLGDSTEVDRLTPTLVAGGRMFAALSSGVGREHTCGIAVDGTAYCWGGDLEAELGTGWITDAQLPTCTFSNSFVLCSPVPVRVRLKIPFVAVTTGSSHTCAIAQSGAAYCWGDDTIGSLGDGVSGSVSQYPSVVAIPTGAASATRSAVSTRQRESAPRMKGAHSTLFK